MAFEERSRARQAVHDLREQLSTVTSSLGILALESALSENGRLALKRIELALESARRELEEIGHAARRQDSPLVRMLRRNVR